MLTLPFGPIGFDGRGRFLRPRQHNDHGVEKGQNRQCEFNTEFSWKRSLCYIDRELNVTLLVIIYCWFVDRIRFPNRA